MSERPDTASWKEKEHHPRRRKRGKKRSADWWAGFRRTPCIVDRRREKKEKTALPSPFLWQGDSIEQSVRCATGADAPLPTGRKREAASDNSRGEKGKNRTFPVDQARPRGNRPGCLKEKKKEADASMSGGEKGGAARERNRGW